VTTVAAVDRAGHPSVVRDRLEVAGARLEEAQWHRQALPAAPAPALVALPRGAPPPADPRGRPTGSRRQASRPWRPWRRTRKGALVDDEVLGPIDFLAVAFPDGRVTGEAFRVLTDLVRRGIIRVLDLEFVAKSPEGVVRKVELDTIEHDADVDVATWRAAESRLLDAADVATIAAAVEPGGLAGVLVYEHVWAVPLLAALDRSRARVIGEGRVAVEDVMAALDRGEPA
jgi:hypothetical protein